MTFRILHHTHYKYSTPVYLSPHYLQFRPHNRTCFGINSFGLDILPLPTIKTSITDEQGNPGHQIWISESTETLDIHAKIDVETHPFNPVDFLIDPTFSLTDKVIPYKPEYREFLKPYLAYTPDSDIKKFTTECKEQESDVITFLSSLTDAVYSNWKHKIRYTPTQVNASECFQSKEGSCRDLSWMLMAMLRAEGFATRFVSGYTLNQLDDGHELHAWVEVLLPGAGWIGLDPSSGLFTDHLYLPIATGFETEATMPVTGTFYGKATSKMETEIIISEL